MSTIVSCNTGLIAIMIGQHLAESLRGDDDCSAARPTDMALRNGPLVTAVLSFNQHHFHRIHKQLAFYVIRRRRKQDNAILTKPTMFIFFDRPSKLLNNFDQLLRQLSLLIQSMRHDNADIGGIHIRAADGACRTGVYIFYCSELFHYDIARILWQCIDHTHRI